MYTRLQDRATAPGLPETGERIDSSRPDVV
jgi:hypothetical protein